MTDVKDNSLDEMLADFELVSMKSHSEGETATAEREQLKQAILEEMDRVVDEVIDLGATADDHLPDKDKILVDMTLEDLKEIQRHRWQEVRKGLAE